MKQKTYVGIDIAKEKFDVFINTDHRIAQFDNTPSGHQALITLLDTYELELTADYLGQQTWRSDAAGQ